MNEPLRAAIEDVITKTMQRVLARVLEEDPFDQPTHEIEKPLYAALVSEEVFKGSHFERRFVTIFGKVWEQLVRVVGEDRFGWAATQHMVTGRVRQGSLERIQRTLDNLEHRKEDDTNERIRPNWGDELAFVRAGTGEWQDVSVACDVYASTSSDEPGYAFELKSPMPNSDQTKVSKEKLLKLHCMAPSRVKAAYFALPFNPYGERHLYDWKFPMRWFDMHSDPCVLIGDDLWDFIGGEGTYDEVIEIARQLGRHFRTRILREYMDIERDASSS